MQFSLDLVYLGADVDFPTAVVCPVELQSHAVDLVLQGLYLLDVPVCHQLLLPFQNSDLLVFELHSSLQILDVALKGRHLQDAGVHLAQVPLRRLSSFGVVSSFDMGCIRPFDFGLSFGSLIGLTVLRFVYARTATHSFQSVVEYFRTTSPSTFDCLPNALQSGI